MCIPPPAPGVTEADWIRWAGVAMAIVGSVVAAPSGGLLIVQQTAAGVRSVSRWLAGKLPFRRHAVPAPGLVHGQAGIGVRFDIRAEGLAIPGAATPTEEQLEMLWKEISRLHRKIGDVTEDARRRHSELAGSLQSAASELQTAHQDLRSRWEEEKRRSVHIDARGLPLIGLGILMTGVPDGLAAWDWFGWLVTAVAVILTLWLGAMPLTQTVIRWLRERKTGSIASGQAARDTP